MATETSTAKRMAIRGAGARGKEHLAIPPESGHLWSRTVCGLTCGAQHPAYWDQVAPKDACSRCLALATEEAGPALSGTTTEWCVLQPGVPGLHRGPYQSREAAQEWIDECEADGFRPGAFVLGFRQVTEWREVGA